MRANQVYKAGPLTLRFLDQVLPMADDVARIKLKGSLFIEAIENGISTYPKYEGRWPVISGLKMQINTDNEPGSRILRETITLSSGEPFDFDKDYTVATKAFMLAGRDGYSALADESNERLAPAVGEDDPSIQDIFVKWFRNFRRTDAELAEMPEAAANIFKRRVELFGGSLDDRHEPSHAIKIKLEK